jgi:NADH-quinone oxidoreductase subunit N
MAAAMTVFMLALLGFPDRWRHRVPREMVRVAGALQAPAPQARLAVLLVVTTAISAGYYLQVVRVMYMKPRPANAIGTSPTGPLTRFVIAAAAILIVALGLFPDSLASLAQRGAAKPGAAETPARGPLATPLAGPAPAGR